MEKPGRLITAMVTPFDNQGGVDYKQAKRLAAGLLDCGSDGLVISGTTGESPTLSKSEKLRLFTEVKETVGRRGWVIAGTGGNDTAASRELIREVEKLGVDACLLVVPYYNKPSQEGLFQHFKSIAESTNLPCILYNVPARTVTNMSAETTIRLSQIRNIIGIKEASGNLEQIAQIIQGARPGFLVWSGNDSDTLPIMALGGYGVISVASHLVGKQMKEMMDKYLQGRAEEAAALHRRLMPLFSALFVVSNPVPVKYALNKLGVAVGKPRLPLVEPDARSAAIIEAAIKASKIDFPADFIVPSGTNQGLRLNP
jgi:4-hydroxy-tetrahydrodipicolinate synthase